jgi:ABC-type phosphate transport system, permease component
MRVSPANTQRVAVGFMWLLAAITFAVLVFILAFILAHGLPHLTWTFLTQSPTSMGREGGIFPMILGTILVAGLAVLVAAPIGVATAVYLTEYTREGRLTTVIRFGADCLAGVPSIIFGLFGFVFFAIDHAGDGACFPFSQARSLSRSWCCRPSSAPARRRFAPCPTPTGRSASV